jgi:peptide/nickel transport system substrate-binding protein
MLAESWDVIDSKHYVFHLRKGVTFHDGKELDSGDVKYSFDRIMDDKTGAWAKGYFPAFESIETPDKYTVKFNLQQASAAFVPLLFFALIVPASVSGKPADYLQKNVNGTGPFTVEDWKPNVTLKLKKNPNYFESGLPYLDGIEVRTMPDESSIIAALRTKQVDHATLEDNRNYSLLKDNADLATQQTPLIGPNVININHRKKEMANVKVLQAMSLALNRQEILTAAGAGLGQITGFIPPALKDYFVPPSELPFYTPDADKAKALLKDAGYPNGFDMDIIYIQQFPLMDISAQVFAAQLQKIGINAKPRNTEYGLWLDLRTKTFDYYISTNLQWAMVHPEQYFATQVYSKGTAAKWDGFQSDELDKMIDNARTITDHAKEVQAWKDINLKATEVVPAWATYANNLVDVTQKYVKDFEQSPTGYDTGLYRCWLDK